MTRAIAAAAQEMDFDTFMSSDLSGGGSSGGRFKWRDQKKGTAIVWLHAKRACVAFPNHNWPRVVEVKDKETGEKEQRVFSDRWGCLEKQLVIESQYFRDKDSGQRKHPPQVCPLCLFVEFVWQMVKSKRWKAVKPILKFTGSRGNEDLTLSAGGICGWFTTKRFEQEPGLRREMKMAHIAGDEVWQQKLLTQKKFLFTVVDDENVGNGLQTCFEGIQLTKGIQRAIEDEQKKLRRIRGGDQNLANPALHPYRFEWDFNSERDIQEMYQVVALRDNEAAPEDVLELLMGEAPDVAHLIAEGDCFALRAEMEAHLCEGVEIPWDEIFGPAQEKGLMNPPEESRAEAEEDDEDPGDFFERKAKEVQSPPSEAKSEATSPPKDYADAGLLDVVVIEVSSPIWKQVAKGGTVDLPKVKGCEVHLDVPEGMDDKLVEKLTGMLERLGAAGVAEIVPCDHCGGPMTTLDTSCPKCGAQVDDHGNLTSRPCLKCNTQTPNIEPGKATICPKCGTIHKVTEEGAWELANPEPQALVPATRRGRKGTSTGAPPFAK